MISVLSLNIIFSLVFFILSVILWKVGHHMSETYDNSIPKWQNRELTAREFHGKILMLISSFTFVMFFGFVIRCFIK